MSKVLIWICPIYQILNTINQILHGLNTLSVYRFNIKILIIKENKQAYINKPNVPRS